MNQIEIKDKKLKKEITDLKMQEVEICKEINNLKNELRKVQTKIASLVNVKYPERAMKTDYIYFEPRKDQKIFLQLLD